MRVDVIGLSKQFSQKPVIRDLNLSVRDGECVVILGNNGAGKSTLLKLLAGLYRPDSGTIQYSNQPFHNERHRFACQIGVLLHEPILFGYLTGRENLQFFGRLYQVSNSDQRIDALLRQVRLETAADDLARTYSRGMQQRLAIARAFLHHPDLLLFDEPFSGLDDDGKNILTYLLRDHLTAGKSVVMTTHDVQLVMKLSTTVFYLSDGKLARSEVVVTDGSSLKGED